MGWTHENRRPVQGGRRPHLEILEVRQLLSADAIQAGAARDQFHVDGSGLAAAVIDTGVNYNHEALGGGFGPGDKVEAGVDFADGHPTPLATNWQHGTAVAGLIASSDPAHLGVAPGADIVALRVFGDDNKGSYDRIAQALQWVIDHHAQYNISVVNLSISDGSNLVRNYYAQDGGVGQQVTTLIAQLKALNIPVVAAAGNSYNNVQGMGFPAIDPDTISATSVDDSGHLAGDAQRLGAALGKTAATDVAAPGTNLTAPIDGNNFTTVNGSSFAAAETTGSVLLLQQIYQSRFGHLPAVDDLDGWLKSGSDPIPGEGDGVSIGEVDVPKAASLIPTPPPPPPPSSGTGSSTGAENVTGGDTSPPTPPPADLVVNGKAQGKVAPGQADTPWGRFVTDYSGHVAFTKVQSWSVGASHPSGQIAGQHHPVGPARLLRAFPAHTKRAALHHL